MFPSHDRGVADAVKILSGAGDQIREYQSALENAGGVTEDVANKQVESLQGQLEILSSKFTEVGLRVVDALAPALEGAIGLLDGMLDSLLGNTEATDEVIDSTERFNEALGMTSKQSFSTNSALNDQLTSEKQLRDETEKIIDTYRTLTEGLRFQEAIQRDLINNTHDRSMLS